MRRALIWLNLYGREAVPHKLKNGLKTPKKHSLTVLSFCRTASRPYRLSQINALRFNQSYYPKNQFMKISWKNIENWQSWKMRFLWGGHFEFSKSAILNFFLLHISEKLSPFIWGIIFFCTMDGFSRILEKKGGGLLCTPLYYMILRFYLLVKMLPIKMRLKSVCTSKKAKRLYRGQ